MLADRIESSGELDWVGIGELNADIHFTIEGPKTVIPSDYLRSLDAALSLLSPENDWRRLTPMSVSVYTASPYNRAAQVRYDGYGPAPAAQLCAAYFRMRAAKEEQALAAKARRASR